MEIDNGKKYEEAIKIHSEVVKTMDGVGYGLLKDGETFYRYGTDADGILFSMREAYEIHKFLTSRDTYWKKRVREEVIEEVFEIEKEKWRDAEHCTCLGYALVQIAGGEESEGGKKMKERLQALTPNR